MPVQPGEGDYLYVVRCRLVDASRETEWNEWYDRVHLPAILEVRGFLAAQRFRSYDEPLTYLAVYDVSSPEVFNDPAYLGVRGWGEWSDYVAEWSTELIQRPHRSDQDGGAK